MSGAGLCAAIRSSALDIPLQELMFSSRWLQSALPHVDGPGVGAVLAWGQHCTEAFTLREAAAASGSSVRRGSERPPEGNPPSV